MALRDEREEQHYQPHRAVCRREMPVKPPHGYGVVLDRAFTAQRATRRCYLSRSADYPWIAFRSSGCDYAAASIDVVFFQTNARPVANHQRRRASSVRGERAGNTE